MKSVGQRRKIVSIGSSRLAVGISGATQTLDSLDDTNLLSSTTLQLFKADKRLFSNVLTCFDYFLPNNRERMLDMGCGYGALSEIFRDALGFKQAMGIDIDEQRALIAGRRGLQVSMLNLDEQPFPFPDNHFDFLTSFGVLDHLRSFDNLFSEAKRVLRSEGCLAISTTNLASWVNRIALLLGYQPRNLEISKEGLFGVHRLYRELYSCADVMKRYTSPTLRAVEELLAAHGFTTLKRWGARLTPTPDNGSGRLLKTLDRVVSKRPSLAVRYIVIAKKI